MNIFNLAIQQMDKEQTEMFAGLTLLEIRDTEKESELWSHNGNSEEMPIGFRMLYKHLQARQVQCENTVVIFLGCSGVLDRPSHVSLYADALMEHQQIDGQPITMAILAKLFPDGFPTIEELNKLWDHKKR